ncbi:MAG TPA: glycosyltransferase family 39 protein [Candidatus Acidoferrales bacterium]|nr:glycosyltransferase family 39 protein [Candidatus Acidoferrales bacterium]
MINLLKQVGGNLRWSQWLGLFGLALLFIALRWNNYNAPLFSDEGECDYAARLMIQGLAPYQHAFIQKPPGVIYSYALADLLLPQYFWSPRLVAYLFVALATALLGFIARLEFGQGFALPTMWLITPMVLLPGLDQYTCNPEMFLLLPLLATIAVYRYSRQHGHKNIHWLAAGFLGAVTLIYKYTALPMLAFVFAAWLLEMHRPGSRLIVILKGLACLLAGGILATILGLGFFLRHDALKSLWECTVSFNRSYVQSSGVFAWSYSWSKLGFFWSNWWVLFLIPWAILLRPQPRIWFWLALFVCAIVSTSASAYSQYYILMMPFWALLSAIGIHSLSCKISERMAKPSLWLTGLMTLIVMLLLLRPDVPWMLCSNKRFASLAGTLYAEAQFVAGKVASKTSPNDFIYVAGSDPEIYCYAQRYSPTRFITTYPLMIPGPSALSYQTEAIHELGQHPPKLIVFVASGASWVRHENSPPKYLEFLNAFLGQNYKMTGGYVKTDDLNGYWLDHLTNEQFAHSSLVFFERKN